MDIIIFLKLAKKITDAFDNREYDKSRKFINEQLDLIDNYKDNWNHSNVIHQSHIFLGLMALEEKKMDEAKEHLVKSGEIKGSPQIITFGPNMTLAQKLLEEGEHEIVLEYFELCSKFWLPQFSTVKLEEWREAVLMKEIPNFGFHLGIHLRTYESKSIREQYNLD